MLPRDLLFMRDARPMEASDAGLGANWPRPDQLWNALINAFHREWDTPQEWEGCGKHTFRDKNLEGHWGRSKDRNSDSSFRFGSLQSAGPFPSHKGEIYLPMPLDLNMRLVECKGTDLPSPLKYAFLVKKLGKTNLPPWITLQQYQKYQENKLELSELGEQNELYYAERNIGIEIDSDSGTTVESKLYQAEYLRLERGVSLAFWAECELKKRGGNEVTDVFEKFGFKRKIVFGGQQGVAELEKTSTPFPLPEAVLTGSLLRWTLITPALFNNGWYPDWVANDGNVMLRNINREPGESRHEWKRRQAEAPYIGGRLIAARVGKPVAFSGWDLNVGGPKPTRLAVPAGSCYVFECESRDKAQELADLLHVRPRSTEDGAKGYGYGVCSTIEFE